MSTAANHASRSHRSSYKHRSAVGNLTRTHWVREWNKERTKARFSVKNFLRRLGIVKKEQAKNEEG